MDTTDDTRVWKWWTNDGELWILVSTAYEDGTLIDVYGSVSTKFFHGVYGYLLFDVEAIVRDITAHYSGQVAEEIMDDVRQWLTRSLRDD
jgi:hypothetical protein